ncbi:hypothetical protein N658DRAFT_567187 [Parathielavia hyrcaniae]|uniref:Spindle pole body component n=1 Tax=Parathielavia hyrcaniae TaxID=113614 RepID=A0AAN6PZQ7_9PEZI|nr:hypothetical protein N658DRAFT_567187 [Parathielavia hyrcaniae]
MNLVLSSERYGRSSCELMADLSDLFSIPDFWRPSTWLGQKVEEADGSHHNSTAQNPLFALDVHVPDTPCQAASDALIDIGPVEPINRPHHDNHIFFKLPALLEELADQQVNLHAPRIEHPEFEPEPLTSGDDDDDDDDDVWLFSTADSATTSQLKSWESFDQPEHARGSHLFVSEAGPAAFDALLAAGQAPADGLLEVLDAAVYCASLLNVALGRSSVLFFWHADKNSFVKTAPHLSTSGISLDSIKAVDRLCIECGNAARHLQAFAEATYSAASTPTRVALAGVVDRLVTATRSELSNHGRHARSILQLQSVVQPAQAVLLYFKSLLKKLARQDSDEALLSCLFEEAQASEYRSQLLREATREVLRIMSKPWTEFVEEWVGLKAEGGTAMTKTGSGKGFVKVADKMWIDDQGFELEEADYFLDGSRLPTFVPDDLAQAMFETGRNLRFLREHHPEHPLSKPDVLSLAMPPRLEWVFDWDAISKLEARVNQYRDAVSRAIQGLPTETQREGASPGANKRKFEAIELDYFGKDAAQVEADLLASIRQLDRPLETHGPQDGLARLLHDRLYHQADTSIESHNLTPHWTLVPLLSFGPVIQAQSSLINQECMKLLFSAHHLRAHINLLRQYFLLGNGLLCSRLTHALFDPNISTAERRAGVTLGGGMMGLRLGGRRTWPPASSELRLALMGILSECYEPPLPPTRTTTTSTTTSSPHLNGTATLPGDLSFAVRDLSPEEIDRCLDPDSLEALDFLRLSYKPPAVLRPILSPAVLVKYDRVFRLLLRVLRMLYVANQLFESASSTSSSSSPLHESETNASLRLRIEAQHFIRQVASYFFDVAIAAPWTVFEAWLDVVQDRHRHALSVVVSAAQSQSQSQARNNRTGTGTGTRERGPGRGGEQACSPDVLRDRQERVLDEILGGLLLRRRQAPVMGLLEEVFGVVLVFAKGVGAGRSGGAGGVVGGGEKNLKNKKEGEDEESAEELYRLFRRKVGVFVTVCRGLGEKMAAAGASGGGELGRAEAAAEVEQLLVRLDLGGFYARGDYR